MLTRICEQVKWLWAAVSGWVAVGLLVILTHLVTYRLFGNALQSGED